MKLRNKFAFGTLGLSVLTMATYCTSSAFHSQEERKKEFGRIMNSVEADAIPEFEVITSDYSLDFLNIPLDKYFVCRGKVMGLRHEDVELGEKAKRLSKLTTTDGEPFFSCEDIVKYLWYEGKYDFAREMSLQIDGKGENIFYGAQLPQFAWLGLSVDEIVNFKDTEKPNALVDYPTYDINFAGFEGAFATKEARRIFNMIKEVYDTQVIVASNQDEICGAVDSARDYKLAVISGHGTKSSLELGKPCDYKNNTCHNEKRKIFADDAELVGCFNDLDQDAVIFLNSCSNAEGGMAEYNLANNIADYAPGRKVIASKMSFSQEHIKVKSIYPFDARIIVDIFDTDTNKFLYTTDSTYVTSRYNGTLPLIPLR